MEQRVYFLRHGESEHNTYIKQLAEQKYHEDPKKINKLPQIRFDEKLIDRSLAAEGVASTLNCKALLPCEIDVVLTSPALRCLETCEHLDFGDQMLETEQNSFPKEQREAQQKSLMKKTKVVVEPLVRPRVSSAWSIIANGRDKHEKFGKFDFSCCESPNDSEEERERMAACLRTLRRGQQVENWFEFRERVRAAKRLIRKMVESGKKVLVVSHLCTLRALVSTSWDSEGKSSDLAKFKHGAVYPIPNSKIFLYAEDPGDV